MGVAQLVYPSDIAKRPEKPDCDCGCHHHDHEHCEGVWLVPPPPPGYPYPYPYPFPPPPHPHHPDDDDEEVKAKSVEGQICKLSKKASVIKNMIDNFDEKRKDAIIKIGGVSYNFGTYRLKVKEDGNTFDDVTEYGEKIMEILVAELEKLKVEIQELAEQIDSDEP